MNDVFIDLSAQKSKRNVILFIVEGESDEIALAQPMAAFMRSADAIDWRRSRTDVFTAHLYSQEFDFEVAGHIGHTVANVVDSYLAQSKVTYGWDNLVQVIHITDTDGAYVQDSLVKKGATQGRTIYLEDRILAADPEDIKRRNAEKKRKTRLMVEAGHLEHGDVKVPYRVFFMSRNLEHALMGREGEHSKEEKREFAHMFRRAYASHPEEFERLLQSQAEGLSPSYRGSWKEIMSGANSLKRASNLVYARNPLDGCGNETN